MDVSVSHITTLLEQAATDRKAEDRLYRTIESRLHRMAGYFMGRERPDNSLQETILVDDAFQRLVHDSLKNWQNREEFFCAAARVMRQILIQHARERNALKRGGGNRGAPLDDIGEPLDQKSPNPASLVELDEILSRIEKKHPDVFKVFHLHYFMGCELKEIAELILKLPYTTVKRRWNMAKSLLHRELFSGDYST